MSVQQIVFQTSSLYSLPSYAPGKVYNPVTNTWITPSSGGGGEVEDVLTVISFPAISSKQINAGTFTATLMSNSPAPMMLISSDITIATVGAGSSVNNAGVFTWTFPITVVGTIGITTLQAIQDFVSGYAESDAAERVLTVDPILDANSSFLDDIQSFYGEVTHVAPHSLLIDDSNYDYGYGTLVGTLPANKAGHVRFYTPHAGPSVLGFTLTTNPNTQQAAKTGWMAGYNGTQEIGVTDPDYIVDKGSVTGDLIFKVAREIVNTTAVMKMFISSDNGATYVLKHTWSNATNAELKVVFYSGGGSFQNIILNVEN